jgi:hypothetical protein
MFRPIITVCFFGSIEEKSIHVPVSMVDLYDNGVVPLLLLFVIFAVRAPNWICRVSARTPPN